MKTELSRGEVNALIRYHADRASQATLPGMFMDPDTAWVSGQRIMELAGSLTPVAKAEVKDDGFEPDEQIWSPGGGSYTTQRRGPA